MKFGKPTSYHTYLAKTWGLVLAITVIMSFATHAMLALRIAWWIALALGVLYCLEGLAISIIMPRWQHDLKTLWRALTVRRQIRTGRDAARIARLVGTVVTALLVYFTTAAFISA